MNCSCSVYECHDVYMLPCSGAITLPVISDEDSVWMMITRFNGMAVRTDVSVRNGFPVVVPAKSFNENYNYTIWFLRQNGSVVDDKCYKLNVMATIFSSQIPLSGTVTTSLPIVTTTGGNVIQHNDLINVIVHDIITVEDGVYSMVKNGLTYAPSTGEIDLTNIGGYGSGVTITIIYEKPL